MLRPPILLAQTVPPADDPAVAAVLQGLARATGARGCVLSIQLLPDGPTATYRHGQETPTSPLVIRIEAAESFRGSFKLYGAGSGPAASPTALECMRPVLEGAVLAAIERNTASHQLEILTQILGAQEEANLVMDATGEILYANPRGEEILALHTQQPLAQLPNKGKPAPLLSLIVAEMAQLRDARERVGHQVVVTGDGGRWRLDVVALSALGTAGLSLVVFTPVRLPDSEELRRRFTGVQISRREAEVLSFVLKGHKAGEIAGQLGITQYTVKDHLKHAYAKLGITSRGQLLARLAEFGPAT